MAPAAAFHRYRRRTRECGGGQQVDAHRLLDLAVAQHREILRDTDARVGDENVHLAGTVHQVVRFVEAAEISGQGAGGRSELVDQFV